MVRFMSLGSGSSGNCYYLGTEDEGILLDAGLAPRVIAQALKAEGIDLKGGHIRGVVLTHDHADHTRAVGVLGGDYHIPIYASEAVHNKVQQCRYVHQEIGASRRNIAPRVPFEVAGFRLTPFRVPHDSVENFGYYISRGDFSFALITDVGHITEEIRYNAGRVRHLVIEANYDSEMLRSGNYPDFLKERVSSPLGHLSNTETADLLCEIYHTDLENIWLCHLSKDNNHPDLCWKTIEHRLFNEGIRVGKDVTLTALRRTSPSPMYLLEP